MTRMPDFFAEVEHDLGRLVHHGDHARRGTRELAPVAGALIASSQAPAGRPASLEPQPEEKHVNIASELRTMADKVEHIGDDVIADAAAVARNGEARGVLADLAGLAQVAGLPAGTIAGVGLAIKTVLSLYPAAPAPGAPAQPEPAPAQ